MFVKRYMESVLSAAADGGTAGEWQGRRPATNKKPSCNFLLLEKSLSLEGSKHPLTVLRYQSQG